MKKYLRHLTTCLAVLFLICAIPFQVFVGQDGLPGSSAEAAGAESDSSAESAIESSGETSDRAKPFSYVHDPMKNPKAAKDIIVNPDAVYGYSPSPDSVRLKEFADADWSDEDLVESARQQRLDYHDSMSELYRIIEEMLGEAKNVEEIARAVSTRRNELRLESYKDNPEGLEKVKKSNLETYGNESGPTPDSLYEKYGSWQTVLEKALSANPGMDACLGLYDEYYDTYDLEERSLKAGSDAYADETQGEEDTQDASNLPDAEDTQEKTSQAKEEEEEKDGESSSSQTYTVVSGDSLWNIALEKYGDGEKWKVIYEANKDEIRNPDLIIPGQELEIPDAA